MYLLIVIGLIIFITVIFCISKRSDNVDVALEILKSKKDKTFRYEKYSDNKIIVYTKTNLGEIPTIIDVSNESIEKFSKTGIFNTDKDEELENEIQKLKKELNDWDYHFGKVTTTYKTAKELEKNDPYKAIELYMSIKDSKYGNFDVLSRLIILFRKTKQKEQELLHIDLKIEEEQHREYQRKEFMKKKYPESADYIEECYNNKVPCINPIYSNTIDFYKKVNALIERKQKLLNKK